MHTRSRSNIDHLRRNSFTRTIIWMQPDWTISPSTIVRYFVWCWREKTNKVVRNNSCLSEMDFIFTNSCPIWYAVRYSPSRARFFRDRARLRSRPMQAFSNDQLSCFVWRYLTRYGMAWCKWRSSRAWFARRHFPVKWRRVQIYFNRKRPGGRISRSQFLLQTRSSHLLGWIEW